MSILNVLLRPDQLLIAVDTLAEDALTGAPSAGAKLLLIPQHNLVLATRGSAQFFLRIYELALPASFRADFTMEQLGRELGLVIDQLWPAYEKAALEAGVARSAIGTELVFGGWSPMRPAWGPPHTPKASAGNSRGCSLWVVAWRLPVPPSKAETTASTQRTFWWLGGCRPLGSTARPGGPWQVVASWPRSCARGRRLSKILAPSSRPSCHFSLAMQVTAV